MAGNAARSQAISLYRSFVREAKGFKDYNFREYALRRARAGFEENRAASGDAAAAALAEGNAALEVLRRQALISSLYTKGGASVMEARVKAAKIAKRASGGGGGGSA
uniref:Complex 1 LYR protein domain-containing protein n=1 Tax=Bicosoecida sp. CB-2014 TaxID=1486930 RepID=A0A7S1G6K1_9STRA|mmetsp:Transcript_17054/g.59786  ORF Transcript_17054/g.59786 Transcript_17054/m.59786 type:complete len:107 (+) Transcript_17054:200-520(+)